MVHMRANTIVISIPQETSHGKEGPKNQAWVSGT